MIIKDVKYGNYDECVLDYYIPEKKGNSVFIYFHGGGLEKGDKKHAEGFYEFLNEMGVAVVSVNYRMYPNAKFPEFIEDCALSIKFVKDNIKQYMDCEKIFVGGSSAGGYISQMLCFDTRYLKNVGIKPSEIAGYFHDAGQPTTHFNVLRERGVDTRRVIVDEAAPLFFIGNEESYPPMHFVVSDNDMFSRFEQNMLILRTLEHFEYHKNKTISHQVMHGGHCEYIFKPGFGQMIYEFIKRYL